MKIRYTIKEKNPYDNLMYWPNDIIQFTKPTFKYPPSLSGMTSLYGSITENGEANGYIGLPVGHRYWGVNYNDIDVEVHGGLTYGGYDTIKGKDYYVIGFDTCHGGDNKTNWSTSHVVAELFKLYTQIK